MIALDTNAVVRMLVEDDTEQAKIVQQLVSFAEQKSITILILPEVLLETVWVLESVYSVKRTEIIEFLNLLLATSTFALPDVSVVRSAMRLYQKGLDFGLEALRWLCIDSDIQLVALGSGEDSLERQMWSWVPMILSACITG